MKVIKATGRAVNKQSNDGVDWLGVLNLGNRIECVPEGWKTEKEIAEEFRLGRSLVHHRLMRLVDGGKMEVKAVYLLTGWGYRTTNIFRPYEKNQKHSGNFGHALRKQCRADAETVPNRRRAIHKPQ